MDKQQTLNNYQLTLTNILTRLNCAVCCDMQYVSQSKVFQQ